MDEIWLRGWYELPGETENLFSKFRYGRMLSGDQAPPFRHDFKDLIEMRNVMHGDSEPNPDLPAGYVFLGQFIDHDLTADSDTAAQPFPPELEVDPTTIGNGREPFLNLDSLYGEGPEVDKDLYETKCSLKLGLTEKESGFQINKNCLNDLPRKPRETTAYLKEPRNDENLGVAQMHVAFIKFHNAVVKSLRGGDNDTLERFEEARKIVTQHYQWIVLNDFLPKVIQPDVLKSVLKGDVDLFYNPDPECPFMPVEFSAAAFRLGHSIVPSYYEWNRIFNSKLSKKNTIIDLFEFTGKGNLGGVKSQILTGMWIIDWRRFFDFTKVGLFDRPESTFAAEIDTFLPYAFKNLPLGRFKPVPGEEYKLSLAVRNLYRGRRYGLPAGQDVARLFNIPSIDPPTIVQKLPNNLKTKFADKTPLWYYILREAEVIESGKRLGPVGSRIVAEVLVKLIKISPYSILGKEYEKKKWESGLIPVERRYVFEMADLLKFIQDQNTIRGYNELNPIG